MLPRTKIIVIISKTQKDKKYGDEKMRKNKEIDELPKALQKEGKEPVKKQTGKKILFVLIILAIIGTSVGGFLLYGPWSGFRDWLITTAMTTMTHQYFATWFYDDETIQEVLA